MYLQMYNDAGSRQGRLEVEYEDTERAHRKIATPDSLLTLIIVT